MLKALKTFKTLSEIGSSTLMALRDTATAPETRKILRTFKTAEAIKMIGCSKSTLHDAEHAGKLEQPPLLNENSSKRKTKQYDLKLINDARRHFGTLPRKPTCATPAIIATANYKGGATKTTTAINLIQNFALLGYRCLLIDSDPQGSSTTSFGLIPDYDLTENNTLYRLLTKETSSIKPLIRDTYWPNIDIIPANLSLYNVEFRLPIIHTMSQLKESIPNLNQIFSENNINGYSGIENFEFYSVLANALHEVQNEYDIIVIDCPPSMGMLSINAIYAANGLVIPVIPSLPDYASTVQFFKMCEEIYQRIPEKEYAFVKIIVSKFEKSDNSETLKELIRHYYGAYVTEGVIPNSEVIKKVATKMLNLFEIKSYEGDKKTLSRIIEPTIATNDEVLQEIKRFWGEIKTQSVVQKTQELVTNE